MDMLLIVFLIGLGWFLGVYRANILSKTMLSVLMFYVAEQILLTGITFISNGTTMTLIASKSDDAFLIFNVLMLSGIFNSYFVWSDRLKR